jgi:hypothetical protein
MLQITSRAQGAVRQYLLSSLAGQLLPSLQMQPVPRLTSMHHQKTTIDSESVQASSVAYTLFCALLPGPTDTSPS